MGNKKVFFFKQERVEFIQIFAFESRRKKKTRSDKTWDNQLEDLNKERGFVIFLYDKERILLVEIL